MMQVPTPVNVTVAPLIEQAPRVDLAAIVSATASRDEAAADTA
jgi:hypothetical protein